MAKGKKEPPAAEEQKALTTRERILEVALEVFAQKGLDGATMTEIAKRAGLTGGAMYRYFANKDEVFNAVVESRSMAFSALEMVRGLIPELEPATALKFISQGMFAFLLSQMDFMRMVVGESVKNPEMTRPFFDKMLTPGRDFLRDCIQMWKEKGLVREDVDPALATIAFMGTVGYFMVERALFENPELEARDLAPYIDDLSDLFLSGLLKRD